MKTLSPSIGQVLATLLITYLAVFGFISIRHDREWLFAGLLLFPIILYTLGFFFLVPESVGGKSHSTKDLGIRLAAWVQWSGAIAAGLGIAYFLWSLRHEPRSPTTLILSYLAVGYSAAPACIAIHRQIERISGPSSSLKKSLLLAPLAPLERSVGAPARRIVDFFTARRSLWSGSSLALASLLLVVSQDVSCHHESYRGYQVLTGEGVWLTTLNLRPETPYLELVGDLGWICYALSIVLAAYSVGLLLARGDAEARLQRLVRLARWTAAAIALFTVTDLGVVTVGEVGAGPQVLAFACWMPTLVAGLRLLAVDEARPEHIAPLVILYLPLLFFGLVWLAVLADDAVYGYLAFYVSALLTWWGYLQMPDPSRNELRYALNHLDLYELIESFVLEVKEGKDLEIRMEAALRREHPKALPTRCWREVRIVFPRGKARWIVNKMKPDRDLDGTVDFGNLYLISENHGKYIVEGELGEIEIVSDPLQVVDDSGVTVDAYGAVPDCNNGDVPNHGS